MYRARPARFAGALSNSDLLPIDGRACGVWCGQPTPRVYSPNRRVRPLEGTALPKIGRRSKLITQINLQIFVRGGVPPDMLSTPRMGWTPTHFLFMGEPGIATYAIPTTLRLRVVVQPQLAVLRAAQRRWAPTHFRVHRSPQDPGVHPHPLPRVVGQHLLAVLACPTGVGLLPITVQR